MFDDEIDPVKTDTTPIEISTELADRLAAYREATLKSGARIDLVSDGELLQTAFDMIASDPLSLMMWGLRIAAQIVVRQAKES